MSALEQLQKDLAERLEAEAYFADIGVYVFRPRENLEVTEIQGKIDEQLNCLVLKAGKGGAAVMVLMPVADAPDANVPGPRLEISVTVRVQEIPLFNMGATGTLKSAEEIGLAVLQAIHHFIPHGVSQMLVAATAALTPNLEFAPKITYDAKFSTFHGLARPSKVATPQIDGAIPSAVTVACATSGAAIYYTLDGSYPRSGNLGAVLYSTPFDVTPPVTIRAGAFKINMQGSDVARVEI